MELLNSCLSFIFGAIILFLWYWKRSSEGKGGKFPLPPGPRGWPFLGYLPFVLANKPTKLMTQLKEKYGNVFGFNIGARYCVVLSDFTSAKEAFSKKAYNSRPPGYMRTSSTHKNFTELDYNNWEDHRTFLGNCLKFLGVGRNQFEEIVVDELSRVIPKLESEAGKADCSIRDVITESINNTVFQLVCSRTFEDNHPVMVNFRRFQKLLIESFSNNMAYLYFPWLDKLITAFQPHARAIARSAEEMERFVRSEIEAREKVHNENSDRDYIDLYLTEFKDRQEKNISSTFDRETLINNSLFLLIAGSDTTRNTLEWLLMSVAAHPDVQDRVHREIVSVIGHERTLLFSDKPSLPYTEAVILESERRRTLAPLNVLRWTTEESVIQGFRIPAETVVINNLWLCHMDPDYWSSPKEFNPDRFLSKDKSRVITPEYFMPFSLGKRNCPGDKMANIEVFLYFAAIMQKFKLSPPKGGVDFSATHRINKQANKPVVRVDVRQ